MKSIPMDDQMQTLHGAAGVSNSIEQPLNLENMNKTSKIQSFGKSNNGKNSTNLFHQNGGSTPNHP